MKHEMILKTRPQLRRKSVSAFNLDEVTRLFEIMEDVSLNGGYNEEDHRLFEDFKQALEDATKEMEE